MVAIAFAVVIGSMGFFSAIVKLAKFKHKVRDDKISEHMKLIDQKREYLENALVPPALNSTLEERNILALTVNGEDFAFYTSSGKEVEFYELAIDFCTSKGENYGFNISTAGVCIRTLARELKDAFFNLNVALLSNNETNTTVPMSIKSVSLYVNSVYETNYKLGLTTFHPIMDDYNEEVPFVREEIEHEIVESSEAQQLLSSEESKEEQTADKNETEEKEKTSHMDEKANKVILEINDVNYVFEYSTQKSEDKSAIAHNLANNFCSQQGVKLLKDYIIANKVFDKASISNLLEESCRIPVMEALLQRM